MIKFVEDVYNNPEFAGLGFSGVGSVSTLLAFKEDGNKVAINVMIGMDDKLSWCTKGYTCYLSIKEVKKYLRAVPSTELNKMKEKLSKLDLYDYHQKRTYDLHTRVIKAIEEAQEDK